FTHGTGTAGNYTCTTAVGDSLGITGAASVTIDTGYTGTVTFSGTNTYTGGTTINGGTIIGNISTGQITFGGGTFLIPTGHPTATNNVIVTAGTTTSNVNVGTGTTSLILAGTVSSSMSATVTNTALNFNGAGNFFITP